MSISGSPSSSSQKAESSGLICTAELAVIAAGEEAAKALPPLCQHRFTLVALKPVIDEISAYE
jgi:hypothetical protein